MHPVYRAILQLSMYISAQHDLVSAPYADFLRLQCRQDQEVGANKLGSVFAHDVNFCAVLNVCDGCKDNFRKKDL